MQTEEDNFQSRIISEADYAIINAWCKDWGFPQIAIKSSLPQYGLIVSDSEGQDIISGFLYLTDSSIAHPEWIVANKKYNGLANRKQAFSIMIKSFENYAKANGRSVFFLSVKDKFLIRALLLNGFTKTDTEMTNLIKII